MSSRQRIGTTRRQGGGGGGGTPPTVGVGPTFGPGNANANGVSAVVRSALSMGGLTLSGNLAARAAVALTALAILEIPLQVQSALSMSLVYAVENPLAVQAALSMPTTATVYSPFNVRSAASLAALAAVENPQQVQSALSMPTLVVTENQQVVQSALSMPTLVVVENPQAVRAALTMPVLAVVENTLAVQGKLTGTALGAPFWQSVGLSTFPAAANNIVCAIPSGNVSGNLLLAFVCTTKATANGQLQINTPAGWTQGATVGLTGTVSALVGTVFWRIADGTEGASVTFNFTGGTNAAQATAEIHRLTGTHATVPIDSSATATLLSSALVPDPVSPSVTTIAANCMVFCFLNHYHAALNQTHTAPATNIERTDFENTVTAQIASSTSDTRVFSATGATGTAVHDCTETASTDAVMLRVAIAPGTVVLL